MMRTQSNVQAAKLGFLVLLAIIPDSCIAARLRPDTKPVFVEETHHLLTLSRTAHQREVPLAVHESDDISNSDHFPPRHTPADPVPISNNLQINSVKGTGESAWRVTEAAQMAQLLAGLVGVGILIALAIYWSSPCGRNSKPYVLVTESPTCVSMCKAQLWGSVCGFGATLILALQLVDITAHNDSIYVPAFGALADTVAHVALALRLLICYVDEQHAVALSAYARGVIRWSLWFDTKTNADSVQLAATWSMISFLLLVFALVSLSGMVVASVECVRHVWHVLLSYLVVLLGVLARSGGAASSPIVQPPLLALVLNALTGVVEMLSRRAAVPAALFGALVLLIEAFTCKNYVSRHETSSAFEEKKMDDKARSEARTRLAAAASGNESSAAFELHLELERRLCVLYCWQELAAAQFASVEDRASVWRTWCGQFVIAGAPFQVPGLAALVNVDRASFAKDLESGMMWPPAGAAAAQEHLLSLLLAAFLRFERAQRKQIQDAAANARAGLPRRQLPSSKAWLGLGVCVERTKEMERTDEPEPAPDTPARRSRAPTEDGVEEPEGELDT